MGDSISVYKDNRDVKIITGIVLPNTNAQGGHKNYVLFDFNVYVNSLLFLFELFFKKYGFGPRQLGKNICSFVTHALHQMPRQCKKPSQYAEKIQKELFFQLRKSLSPNSTYMLRLNLLQWTLEELHLMLPILQNCSFVSLHYPGVRGVLTWDLKQMQYSKMTGSNININQTQKQNITLQKQKHTLEFILSKVLLKLGETVQIDKDDFGTF